PPWPADPARGRAGTGPFRTHRGCHRRPRQGYQGHMGNLAALSDESFDIIFNPVSTVFVEDLDPVWRECARVLRPNGRLMTGFVNPSFYLFDHEALEESGDLRAVHRLPYSDLESLDEETLSAQLEAQVSLEYSHSWEKQIGGQCRAGLAIADLYEDDWDEKSTGLQGVMPLYAATLAMKLDLPI
ncbi:MAG: methyltransferase domain-containing protein, partial [Verrucomicrobiota bacterium]